jgi:hypothetical protein
MTLLAAVPESDFFAFCDQDDVWLPDKLSRAVSALNRIPADVPALYCTRQHLVDKNLKPIGLSSPAHPLPSFANALVQNIAVGCTIVLNASARKVVLATPIPTSSIHDWWSYLNVTGAVGHVRFEDKPSILYRQHDGNTIGSAPSFVSRARGAIKRGPFSFLRIVAEHIEALEQAKLSAEAREVIFQFQNLDQLGPLSKIIALKKAGIYRQGLTEDLVMRVWFAFYNTPLDQNKVSQHRTRKFVGK